MSDPYFVIEPDHAVKRVPFELWRLQSPDERRVARTDVGAAEISTVFLGIDHRFGEEGPPLLFETMIFGGELDESQWRCSTWDEAVRQHEHVVELVRLRGVRPHEQ